MASLARARAHVHWKTWRIALILNSVSWKLAIAHQRAWAPHLFFQSRPEEPQVIDTESSVIWNDRSLNPTGYKTIEGFDRAHSRILLRPVINECYSSVIRQRFVFMKVEKHYFDRKLQLFCIWSAGLSVQWRLLLKTCVNDKGTINQTSGSSSRMPKGPFTQAALFGCNFNTMICGGAWVVMSPV